MDNGNLHSWTWIPISARGSDLKELVRTAHRHGIYVILDIILNHSGNVFSYAPDRYVTQDPGSGNTYLIPPGMVPPTRWLASMMPAAGQACHSDRLTGRRTVAPGRMAPSASQEFQEPATFSALGAHQQLG